MQPPAKPKTKATGKPAPSAKARRADKTAPAAKRGGKASAAPARKVRVRRAGELSESAGPRPELGQDPLLGEEEQIEAAKYLPRERPPRLFEEERFIFPESYGVTRLRLMVKDPFWLFAHWDVAPTVWSDLKREFGERRAALSRLTLRIVDAQNGGGPVILLPAGARSWYIQADSLPRSYRAELGLTLPSGEFRRLAESNLATTPRVGPSPRKAGERQRWDATERAGETLPERATPAGRAPSPEHPWAPQGWNAGPTPSGWISPGAGPPSPLPDQGGASDAYRR